MVEYLPDKHGKYPNAMLRIQLTAHTTWALMDGH